MDYKVASNLAIDQEGAAPHFYVPDRPLSIACYFRFGSKK